MCIRDSSKFGSLKTAGPDEIKPIVLQKLPQSTIKRITRIYRASIELGYMPNEWKRSEVVFIPKPGKDNYQKAKSFRPISLTSFLLKGLERIVGWHLENTILKASPISDWQHGFKRERSTETAILTTVDRLESSILRGGFGMGAFLDIQGAFDSLVPDKAIEAMERKGFPPWFLSWYDKFLKDRTASATYKGAKVMRYLSKGTPQGDVLSTLIWNILYDPMLYKINTETACKATGFADDGSIIQIGPDLTVIRDQIQQAVNCAVKWGEENGMKFNCLLYTSPSPRDGATSRMPSSA